MFWFSGSRFVVARDVVWVLGVLFYLNAHKQLVTTTTTTTTTITTTKILGAWDLQEPTTSKLVHDYFLVINWYDS